MNYDKKFIEEIVGEFKQWPEDEFMPYLRYQIVHYIGLIRQSSALLEVVLEEETQDQKSINDAIQVINNSTEALEKLIHSAVEFDTIKRNHI